MAVGYSTDVRNARLQAVADAINGGSGAGKLRVYDGARPATGGTVTNLLVEFTLPNPFEDSISGGVLTAAAISPATASGTGTATWFRIIDGDGTFVLDDDVGGTGSGKALELSSTSISSGQTVTIDSLTITAGNA